MKVAEPFIIQTSRGNNKGNIHSIAPTLTSNAYQENNFICEDVSDVEQEICKVTGLLNIDSCGKALRIGGNNDISKKHNYQHILLKKDKE